MICKKQIIVMAIWTVLVVPVATLSIPQAQAGITIGIGIHVGVAPPPLPLYVQPPLPEPGYMWTPGYWAYGDAGYYWVPGVWARPPVVGVLWTPGYWGFDGGYYRWHSGYWGPHVGFYGGVNYGFGYGGIGFVGGYWRGGLFVYNRAAANFGAAHVTSFYSNTTIVRRNTIINRYRLSYNGGQNGIRAQPTTQDVRYARTDHLPPTANQQEQRRVAGMDRGQLASVNHGRPAIMAATDRTAYIGRAQARERTGPITAADRAQGRRYQPNNREANQDQRIANGLKTGQMTSGEAARADRRQANIDQQVRDDRQANGGRLTSQERGQVGREQNGASRQIYNEKHNGKTIAPNEVDDREANQQQRVANGLRHREETSGEAARADRRQANLDRRVHNDRVANGGRLHARQRRQINRRQNKNSRQIHRQKHKRIRAVRDARFR